jgi:hypothetical protein
MDEMTKIVACSLEIITQYEKIKDELSEPMDSGVLEFVKNTNKFISELLDVGVIEFNEETKEYDITAQIPFKIEWILFLNDSWWLNLEKGIQRNDLKTY